MPITDFREVVHRGVPGRDSYCRECRRKIVAKWNMKRKAKVRGWLMDYLRHHPCVDCGETDLVVLEFDHIDPATKAGNVGAMLTGPFGALKAEVEKCEVVCANCHRRREARRHGGWARSQVSELSEAH